MQLFDILNTFTKPLQLLPGGFFSTRGYGKDRTFANTGHPTKTKRRRRRKAQLRKELRRNRMAKGQNPRTGRQMR